MIISNLIKYYDTLSNDKKSDIPKIGYCDTKVSFAVVISNDGEFKNIISCKTEEKHPSPKSMKVPYHDTTRSSNIKPMFLCDTIGYIFGLEAKEKTEKLSVTKKSKEKFEASKILNHKILDGIDNPSVKSLLMFIDKWNPEMFETNTKIVEHKKDLICGGFFIYEINGEFIHEIPEVCQAWEKYYNDSMFTTDAPIMQDAITGKMERVARIHDKIYGVPGTTTSGGSLVSFNDDCFCSYGKEKSFNSPIGIISMIKYVAVLNYLLRWGSKNRINLGNSVAVFWAETNNPVYEEIAQDILNPPYEKRIDDKTQTEDERKNIRNALKRFENILQKSKNGILCKDDIEGLDPNVKFYMLGLSGNQGRISIRFWYENTFGKFLEAVIKHHNDMEIIQKFEDQNKNISIYNLLRESIPSNTKPEDVNDKLNPLLYGALMRSILDDTRYPRQLYDNIVLRIGVEKNVSYRKAAFIKTYLIRNEKEKITMSLDETRKDVPYLLGRLFSVLEKTQRDAVGKVNCSISEKYMNSAAARPATIFPLLMDLSRHHITKSNYGYKSKSQIEEIVNDIKEFPKIMNLKQRGIFYIGYYHQNKKNYEKKEKED